MSIEKALDGEDLKLPSGGSYSDSPCPNDISGPNDLAPTDDSNVPLEKAPITPESTKQTFEPRIYAPDEPKEPKKGK